MVEIGATTKICLAGGVVMGLVAKLSSTMLLKNGEGKGGGAPSK